MKVLLLLTDLYNEVGGGQTVYKKIVEATPEVDFFYFVETEAADVARPPNAHPIRAVGFRNLRLLAPPPHAAYKADALRTADRIAQAVAGQDFDIVDVPDFITIGSMLPSAFAHHGVSVGRIVLAMHGNISRTIDTNWGTDGDSSLEHKILEREQFDLADAVYSVSPRYLRDWQSIVNRSIHYIDPAHFALAARSAPVPLSSKPSLYCIGRSERRKGNDLFVELVRWLDPQSFEKAEHIGSRVPALNGHDSAHVLNDFAQRRGVSVEYKDPLDRQGLADLFAKPSIVVLPVRYDTLNLVALDALFSGCPIAVSSKAGVCDYLDETHPHLPYVKLDLDDFYGAAAALRDLVENYGAHRQKLHAALAAHDPNPATPFAIDAFYRATLAEPRREPVSSALPVTPYEPAKDVLGQLVSAHPRQIFADAVPDFLCPPAAIAIESLRRSVPMRDRKFRDVFMDARSLPGRFRYITDFQEIREAALREKLDHIHFNAKSPLYRCNFWLEIARLQRLLGNELLAVTYELRALRLLGRDPLNLLPRVMATLYKNGLVHEAEAVKAMYANPSQAEERVYAYLKQTYERNLDRQDKPFEVLDDRRSGEPKVAVIVSLYKAADKLAFFLNALAHQKLVRQGQVEIILVDSGSPTAERAVLMDYLERSPLNVVYARSQDRETIQAAWNRGIGLARAPYLVFLGVDETLYPEALETLADELDRNPHVDWVMANSLVTAVSGAGLFEKDIMPYDRAGATKHHVYLETCYLSWVGGMYRKSLHERFGYYDESFSAAGDTEFKNRILPHITVKFIDKMLGLFLNYPDGQTTLSSKAEIEDMRAWYVHRTPGGVRYAFENGDLEAAEQLLYAALGYRKSYCGHMSSDIEYARYLAAYLGAGERPSPIAASLEPGLEEMLQHLRNLELVDHMPSRFAATHALAKVGAASAFWEKEHRRVLASVASPHYNVFNDNRYEQHSWLWAVG